MKFRPMLGKTAIVGATLLAAMACGKKKSSSSAAATGAVEPNDDTLVTLATGALQLAGEVTILQGKESAGASLASHTKEVSFKLLDERTVRLRMTNEAFEDVEKSGEIMCILSQTKFWEQANEGVYQVQVDNNLCKRSNSGGGGNSQDGQSSDNQAPDLQVIYVKSVREENKPLIAEMRVAAGEGGEDAFYHVKVVVVEPPSDTAPAGIFDMRYTAHMGTKVGESGFIRTKKTSGEKFVLESGGNGSGGEGRTNKSQGIAELEVLDENTVIGYVHSDSAGTEGEYSYSSKGQARFDANFLNVDYVTSNTSPQGTNTSDLKGCYDLNKFKTAMFRYDLVDATGKVVQRNSGFPVEFTKDGQTRHGWAGYHGLWLGQSGSAATGDIVNKVTWGNGGTKTSTPYTVFAAPGKLTKLTKATVTLGELKGVDINFWDSGSNYIVKWDGTTLSKSAKVTYGNNGPEEEAATGAITIPQWGANLWVSSLNASVQISPSVTLSDSLTLSYHSQKIVSGSADVPTCELKCFQNCPVMAPAASAFQRSQGGQMGPMVSALYKTTSVNWGGGAQDVNQTQNVTSALATYTWDASTQNLKEGSTAFALPSGLSTDQESSQNMQNVFSGALVCADAWSAIADKNIDPWRMSSAVDTYYSFQSGPMDWNKFIGLKDSTGTFVAFDAPLELSYTHTTANDWDANTDTGFIGKSFRLQYSGPGNLQGIPWKYSKDTGHHMPLFSIKSGATVGAYKIYPIDGEQRLAKAEAASCAAIPLEGAPELPSLDSLTAIDVGSLGDANSELRYVGGVAVE